VTYSEVMRPFAVLAALGLIVSACGGDTASSSPDLEIERRTGFAVIVEQRTDGASIGFNAERDAASGEEFDVSESVWRIEDGPWNEPPVNCLGRGQRIEIGVAQVQNEARPGLLKERVVWVSCLASEESS